MGHLLEPKRIRRGNAIAVRYVITNARSYPPGALFDPDGAVRITLFHPDLSLAVGPVAMSKVTNHPVFPKGLYEYVYQTTGASPLGTWTAESDETHQGQQSVSLREDAFILES